MTAENVAQLYMRLDESDATRVAIGRGDFPAVGVVDLTDAEKKILMDAATETLPDVVGFSLGDPSARVTVWAPYRYVAEQYVTRFTVDPAIQAQFLNWRIYAGVSPDG